MSPSQTWICPGCGANYPPAASPPQRCPVCEDERQWVPPGGQRWTSMEQLATEGSRTEVRELEPGLIGIGAIPDVGVGQRGVVICTPAGNLLWDPPAFIDEAAIDAVRRAGGLRAVSSSHPHMYGALVDWSHAFEAEILLPEDDLGWLQRPDPRVRSWAGSLAVAPGVTLVQCGGHFPGSAIVHWAAGAEGRGALVTGDTILVTPGEDRLTFGWSAPNRLPLSERAVRAVIDAVAPYRFDRIYCGWWTRVLRADAERALQRSAERYIQCLRGEQDQIDLGP
ncbi:MAG: hypothetical protein ACR2NR_12245 [Solirubrobacteraceae bacterium]